MNIISISGLVIITVIVSMLLGQYKPEYKIFLSIAVVVIIFIFCCSNLKPLKEIIERLFNSTSSSGELFKILYKCLGITYITGITADICSDSGEKAMATNVEFAGKIAIIYVAMPLITETIKIVEALTSL